LLDYDDRIVEAHRGYIKCAAVSGAIVDVLDRYRKRLSKYPDDPILMYATGLCLTYLDNLESLEESKKLISRAIGFNGHIEYFHQTLGYIHEVLETVYHEQNGLENALESYQKAYFLNDHEKNKENAANLELNIGNSFYLLRQYGKAFNFYSLRKDRSVEFQNPNTKIIFYKRYGECAFQTRDIQNTIIAFKQALDLIEQYMDPRAPVKSFERLIHFINEQIIATAYKVADTADQAKILSEKQSTINSGLEDLNNAAAPPPSKQWQAYRDGIMLLLSEQQTINKQSLILSKKVNKTLTAAIQKHEIKNPEANLSNYFD